MQTREHRQHLARIGHLKRWIRHPRGGIGAFMDVKTKTYTPCVGRMTTDLLGYGATVRWTAQYGYARKDNFELYENIEALRGYVSYQGATPFVIRVKDNAWTVEEL